MAGITTLLNAPFYEGQAVSADTPHLLPVSIGDHGYIVDLTQYRRRTIPALRQPTDQGEEVGENSLNPMGLWKRAQSDWSLGAGQRIFDAEDSSRQRVYTSRGVNLWEPDELSLLPDTSRVLTSTATNFKLLAVDDYLYVVDGSALKHTTDGTTYTTVTTTGLGSITSITTDGATVFVCDGVKIMKTTVGAASASNFGSYAADAIGYGNGRLLAANDAELVELDSAGASTVIDTHDNSSFDWAGVAAAPNGLYVWGSAGKLSEIHFIGINNETGGLRKPISAMPLTPNEKINTVRFYGGLFILATSKGLRLAVANDAGHLSHGALVDEPGDVLDVAVDGEFAWFTWTNYDASYTGTGRLRLSRFTDQDALVPAFASDLLAATQGTSQAVARFDGETFFAISASGVWNETANKVASGVFDTGEIRWGTLEHKLVVSVDMRHSPLDGSISPTIINESGVETAVGSSSTADSVGPTSPLDVNVEQAEWVRVRFTLSRSSTDATQGPVLRRWTLRALPTPVRIDEIIAPLIVKPLVETGIGEGTDIFYDVLDEFLYLKDLESRGRPIQYAEGAQSTTAYIDGVELVPDAWTDENRFLSGRIVVRLVTLDSAG